MFKKIICKLFGHQLSLYPFIQDDLTKLTDTEREACVGLYGGTCKRCHEFFIVKRDDK